jgi:hypothetical protein
VGRAHRAMQVIQLCAPVAAGMAPCLRLPGEGPIAAVWAAKPLARRCRRGRCCGRSDDTRVDCVQSPFAGQSLELRVTAVTKLQP